MDEHKGKAHKPAKDHPWRKLNLKASEDARVKSQLGQINNYLKGGGKPGR